MSISFEHAVDIARSPDQVFALIEDFSRTPEWLISCAGIEKLSLGPNAVGTKLRYTLKGAMHSGIMEGQITTYVPNERLSLEYSDRLVSVLADFRLVPSQIGTYLTHQIAITPKTFIVRMLTPLIQLQVPKETMAAMATLRSILEAGPA